MLLAHLAKRVIRSGTLRIIDAAGRAHEVGDGTGRPVTIRLHGRALRYLGLALHPDLCLGEAYMDGRLTVEEGDLYGLLDLCAANSWREGERAPVGGLADHVDRALRRLYQYNPVPRARTNVAHHYDLSDALYDLFLDADRQYSCAYFAHRGADLDEAQAAKKRHLAAKLLIEPGQRVLDIGCGWGGLALYLARLGADVTGITLSKEQLEAAHRRAASAGLAERARFHLRDYREETGRYDRIVSVGMFEHVGVSHYPAFFAKVRELLADDGVAVLHSIGRMNGPGCTSPWIRKYIFPGGYAPALSEVLPAVERLGLWVTDIEILRLHYALTLRHWRRRFLANRAKAARLYDERFCRMWEYYLTACELAFRRLDHMVFQMQLAKRRDAVPLTRDYITDWERRHAAPGTEAALAAE